MDARRPVELSEEFVKRPPGYLNQDPHLADSQNSSVVDEKLFYTPDHGSAVLSNGNNFPTESFHNYIDDLHFDPRGNYEDPMGGMEENNVIFAEVPTRKRRSKSRKEINRDFSGKFRSKVLLPASKRPTAYLDPSFLRSQQQLWCKKRGKSTTNKVIRGWGKRPLLVESEAPWTPRNRMYLNAIKAISRARQMSTQNQHAAAAAVLTNFRQNTAQQSYNGNVGSPPSSLTKYFTKNDRNGNGTIYFNQRANSRPLPEGMTYYPVAPPPTATIQQQPPQQQQQQQPVVSSMPMPVDFNNRPLTVAYEAQPTTNYIYHPGMMPPSPQPFVYGQLNPQSLWLPMMERAPLQSRQAQQ